MNIKRPDPDESEISLSLPQSIGTERPIVVAAQAWTVHEVIDPVTLTRTLVFTGRGIARRVREYPAKWRDLTDEQLYALSWRR